MKKALYILSAALTLMLASCERQLDIIPLGQTTLSKVDDLETLLNTDPTLGSGDDALIFEVICNNIFAPWNTLDEYIGNHNCLEYAIFTSNETVDRAEMVTDSYLYSALYKRIYNMNVVISKMPDASNGTVEKKAQLVAEARVLRAWYHFLLVNMYAKQYDEATADALGGIAYVDNTDVSEQKTKLPLAKVYEKMLADCSDEVLANLIQSNVDDPCRFGVDFGYGVRAKVLFQMKRYDEALKYANLALAVNSQIEDRSGIASTMQWDLDYTSSNNYYLISSDGSNLGDYYGLCISPEVAGLFDPSDYRMIYESWDTPYPEDLPEGSLQYSGMGTVRYNVWGIRSETMYYLAAECMIRSGNVDGGLAQIDKVRELRIDPTGYKPFAGSGASKEEAMKLLQGSKRVEFLNTFENFCDRKRWNSEADYAESIVRDLGQYGTFELKPDSPLWVFPFPVNAVNHNSSLTQNY